MSAGTQVELSAIGKATKSGYYTPELEIKYLCVATAVVPSDGTNSDNYIANKS